VNRSLRTYAWFFSVVALVVALDQWTKWLVRAYVPLGGTWLPAGMQWLDAYARITHFANSGAAFSFFQSGNLVFTIVAIGMSIAILYYLPQISEKEWLLRLALSLYLAGVLGNLIDRLRVGEVTDFISVGTFAIFNVADASINVGVALLILGVWLKSRTEKKQDSDPSVSV
jgi:signal peptidase II